MVDGGSVRHRSDATVHGKTKRGAGKHQGAEGELTAGRVAGEERQVELSTVRAFGAVRKLVGMIRWGWSLLGEMQNGFVAVCKSYGREELEGGGLWSSNFNWRSAMAWVALLCARSEMGEGGSRNGRGCALEPRDARALASLATWLDELSGEWLRAAVAPSATRLTTTQIRLASIGRKFAIGHMMSAEIGVK